MFADVVVNVIINIYCKYYKHIRFKESDIISEKKKKMKMMNNAEDLNV